MVRYTDSWKITEDDEQAIARLPERAWETSDLDAWMRLLALHDIDSLADAEPDTMHFRFYHLPARLADHARRRWLRIEKTWPWAEAFTTCWQRLTALPDVTCPQPTAPVKQGKDYPRTTSG